MKNSNRLNQVGQSELSVEQTLSMTYSSDATSDFGSDEKLRIPVAVEHELFSKPLDRYREIVRRVCADAGYAHGEVSIAIVNDQQMKRLHRDFLGVDETTDVISFPLSGEQESDKIEAEIVVCWEEAQRRAIEFDWNPEDELLLYVVHGILHLVGFDDTTETDFERMREAESKYLGEFGLNLVGRDQSAHPEDEQH